MDRGYIDLMANKIVRHKDNWKDNPNRYTSLFMIITPILSPKKRAEFNKKLRDFSINHYGMRPESAERLAYNYFNPFLSGVKLYIKSKEAGYNQFDTIKKTEIDIIKLERGLRELAFWLLIEFKQIAKETGVNFESNQFGISDIQNGIIEKL